MSLADRIARLEAKFARVMPIPTPEAAPVLAITLRGEQDDGTPFCIEYEGRHWEQRADETVHDLHVRARGEVLASLVPDEQDPVLILVARQGPERSSFEARRRPERPRLGGKTCGDAEQTVAASVGVSDQKE